MSAYPGQDNLISYLKKQGNKSYRGFLNLHHDVIIASVTSPDLTWYNLDNAWASNYKREVEKIYADQQKIIEILKKKINVERIEYKKELQAYWQKIIKEYEKENLIPEPKLHSKKTIDLPKTSQVNHQPETKSHSKKTIKILTNKDLPESSHKKSNKRNNNDDTDNASIELRKKQKQNKDYITDDLFHMTLTYENLILGNINSFIKLLKETLLTRSQRSLYSANEPVLQAVIELLLPSRCRVPELCLIMSSVAKKGNGKYGFLDIFVLGENYINIELKYISLTGLENNINGKQTKEFNTNELEELDEVLEREDEESLLRRQYKYFDKEANKYVHTTINEVLNNGRRQLERYIGIIAKGQANKFSTGVCDKRIKVINSSSNKLIGFIIIVVGFRRIIWRSIDEKLTNYKYIKIK